MSKADVRLVTQNLSKEELEEELGNIDRMVDQIEELKIEIITQAGRLDFMRADAKIVLSQIQLAIAENEKLAVQLKQLETQYDMMVHENKKEGQ
jgi:hypothetical protein